MRSKCNPFEEELDVLIIGRFIGYLKDGGFYKQGEVAFPHKQSAVMKLDRESWEAPAL